MGELTNDNTFDPLWIDRPEAMKTLRKRADNEGLTPALKANFEEFFKYGYTIIRGAVSAEAIDAYRAQLDDEMGRDRLQVSYGRDVGPLSEMDPFKPLTKILDPYAYCPGATDLAFAPPVHEFMSFLFEDEVLAFQGLHFEVGSTQAVHQDVAYVVVDRPKQLAAAWIALEDIPEGSGELVYYPGSHRFPDYLYNEGKSKSWNPAKDGQEIHNEHLKWIHSSAKERGIKLQHFLPKKGDVLLWHADLAHGGGKISNQNATRRSLVIHYCPVSVKPKYFNFLPRHRKRRPVAPGAYFGSMYYELGDQAEQQPGNSSKPKAAKSIFQDRLHLIGLGFEKCGTTALNAFLQQSKKFACPKQKETFFFNERFGKGNSFYEKIYSTDKGTQCILDITPSYIRGKLAVERIAEFPSDKKYVISLRHPVQRAFSHYVHDVVLHHAPYQHQRYRDSTLFENVYKKSFLDEYREKFDYHFTKYLKFVERTVQLLGRDRIMFTILEEDFADWDALRARLEEHTGVGIDVPSPRKNQSNVGGALPYYVIGDDKTWLRNRDGKEVIAKSGNFYLVTQKGLKVWKQLENWQIENALEASKIWASPVSETTISDIYAEYFSAETPRLEEIIGRSLKVWEG